MCFLVAIFTPAYLAIAWIATGFAVRDVARRRPVRAAAVVSLGLAIVVSLLGVPYTRDSTREPALLAAIALLALGPIVLPRLSQRGRHVGVAMLVLLSGTPVVRVEYLTWRYAEELRDVYEREAGAATDDEVLFSVFARGNASATVLRVEGRQIRSFAGGTRLSTMGYFLEYRRAGGVWEVDTNPQAVLWSDGGSAFVACPYPISALLLLRGVTSGKC